MRMNQREIWVRVLIGAAVVSLVAAAGCGEAGGPKSSRGFRLPDGDIGKGKEAFVQLKCHACHKVQGVELPVWEGKPPVFVVLGGEVARVKSYGELVTGIINPSHDFASGYDKVAIRAGDMSRMANYNDKMTLKQLIDVVAFLQSRYEKLQPEYDSYPML